MWGVGGGGGGGEGGGQGGGGKVKRWGPLEINLNVKALISYK